MTVWEKITVQDLVVAGEAEIKTGPFGTQLHASDYVDEGIPVINVRNIGFGEIKSQNLEYISEATAGRLSSHLLQSEDIVFGRKGAVERHAFIKKAQVRWFQGSDCLRLRINSPRAIPRFVSYRLLCEEHKQWMMNQCSHGATMASLNQDIVKRIPLKLPPLSAQRKITSILSAYDDLIENNLRRIKILEEMAQTIYREWFVRFRFPGHQKVKMVDSPLGKIPEGWTYSTVGEACQALVDGDWIETKDQGGDDFRLLQVSNIGVGEFIETGNYRYVTKDTFKKLNCTEVLPGQILISRMPKPTGRAWLVTEMPWRMITAVDVAILSADKGVLAPLLFVNILNSSEQLELVAKHSTGTTRERISRSALSRLPVILPPLPLQDKFSAITEPCYCQITILRRKNTILRQTHDLLLPKLISGELDVSELDIAIPEANA